MVGQILFDGWGWLIAVAVVTLVLPGVGLAVLVWRGSLTRGDVALLLAGVLVLAGLWGFMAWARHLLRTHQPLLEDDGRVCGHALDTYASVNFQEYETEACERAGVDLREIERDRREHPRQLTTREREAIDRHWRTPRPPVTIGEWWRGPQAYSRARFCATPGITCLD